MVGFAAGLSPTSFHLSPTSFHLSPTCGRVLPLPFICLPLLFICLPGLPDLSPSSFHLSPRLGSCGRVSGWLAPTSFHLSPTSFHFLPGWVLVVGFPAGLSPTSSQSPTSFHLSPRLGACGRVPGWLVSHFLSYVSHFFSFVSHFFSFVSHWLVSHFLSYVSHFFFPKQFTVRGSQCFKEWSPWCWMVWSGSRPACLPLPFICLPVLFICLPSWVLVVGFPAGLFFLSFVSHFFSSSFHLSGCLWSGSRLACLPLPFICLPLLFICLPVLFICLPGWVLAVGFPAGLSPTSFHLSPTSFHLSPRLGACGRVLPLPFICLPLLFICLPVLFICLPVLFICLPGWVLFICLPGWVLVVGFPAGLSPTSFHLSPTSFHLSPRLGACGRVPGWLVSHFQSFVSHFFSFVSQAGCLWSGSRLACLPPPVICLPLLFICLPGWVLVVGFPAGLSPTSFHLSPTLFICPAGCLWSGLRLACLPLPFVCLPVLFICLPGWVVSQARCLWSGLSPTSFHLSPTPFQAGCLVWFPAGLSPTSFHLSPTSFHLSPRLGACSRVSGRLVSHFLAFVSHFFPKQFTVRGSQFFLKMCPPFVSLLVSAHFHWPCSISIHLSPRSVTAGVRPFPLTMQHFYSFVSQVRPFPLAMQHFYSFVSQACHCWCPPFSAGHVAFL